MRSIKMQIAMLALVPLLGIFLAAAAAMWGAFEQLRKLEAASPTVSAIRLVEATINELQKERGQTLGLITSGFSDASAKIVAAQRQATDEDLNVAAQYFASGAAGHGLLPSELLSAEKLQAHRKAVDARLIDAGANVAFYSALIGEYLHHSNRLAAGIGLGELSADLMSFVILAEALEAGGLERAIGSRLFIAAGKGDAFHFPTFLSFFQKMSASDTSLKQFMALASPAAAAGLKAALESAPSAEVGGMRKILLSLPETGEAQGIEGKTFFDAATRRLELLRAVGLEQLDNVQIEIDGLTAQAWGAFWQAAALAVALIVLSVAISVFQITKIVRSLRRIRDALMEVARDNTELAIPMADRKDEIGELARAGRVFQTNARRRKQLEQEAAQERELERIRQNKAEEIIARFRLMIQESAHAVNASTDTMMERAGRVTQGAADAFDAAAQARSASANSSTSVQTVAAAAEELASAISEIATQSNRSASIIEEATRVASETDTHVASLAEAAQRIGTVVEMIRAIAEQTNLLALNATIEAARAGEAGRGFAVVAAEVKELSSQTARATGEIASQIQTVQELTDRAVASIREISRTIASVMDVTGAIKTAVGEQSAATKEITQSITVAADGSDRAADNVTSVASSIEMAMHEAHAFDALSREVKSVSAQLAKAVDGFLTDMSRDVEERRQALRRQVSDEPVTLLAGGVSYSTSVVNESDAGLGLRPVKGLREGQQVEVTRHDGRVYSARVAWSSELGLGLKDVALISLGGGVGLAA